MAARNVHIDSQNQEVSCPVCIALVFQFSALAGVMLTLLVACLADAGEVSGGNGRLLQGFLLFCAVAFWRQFHLKRWACRAGCLAAWSLSLLSVLSFQRIDIPIEGLCLGLSIILAPFITAALVVGRQGLNRGF